MSLQPEDLECIDRLRQNVGRVILGKAEPIKLLVTALLARGHVLIEDIPGIGKTALARALAKSVSCSFKRIQFTPDLLPSDITGVTIFDPQSREFVFKPGPIFAHIILADEINRTTPRTQSALLEAMNDANVTVDGIPHELPDPFMVIATQNPLEFTGTYPLPESQLDRFLMILRLGYPEPEIEREILAARTREDPLDSLKSIVDEKEVRRLNDLVGHVRMDDSMIRYISDIVIRTRNDKSILAGVSPRGSLHLSRAARSYALVSGRDYCTPDDVKAVAGPVLSHRIIEKRGRTGRDGTLVTAQIVKKIIQEVPVPQ